MKNKKTQLIFLTVVSFAVGIFIMAAIRSANMPVRQINPRNEELIRAILALETEIADLEDQRRMINENITAIHEEQTEGESQLSLLSQSLESLRQSAALTELQGPGLIITIDDNKEGADKARFSSPENFFPENYIVHDKDLLYIVRAVSPDSEAIAINNVRLNNNSHIRCAGTVILVNYAILAPPYEIRIIGDPEKLLQSLHSSSRYQSLLSKMMPIKTAVMEEITLPGYSGGYVLNYSKPAR
ncbi:MAG: DUF881 domain-containing protein [Clostridiales bacterium]|nr:DUF881 domain-containing protein [Clostridiales bacterium]